MGKVWVQEKLLTQLVECQFPKTISSFIVWSMEIFEDTHSSKYYCIFIVISCTVISKTKVKIRNVTGIGVKGYWSIFLVNLYMLLPKWIITVFLVNRSVCFTNNSRALHVLGNHNKNNKSQSCFWWHFKCQLIPRKLSLTELIFMLNFCVYVHVCMSSTDWNKKYRN